MSKYLAFLAFALASLSACSSPSSPSAPPKKNPPTISTFAATPAEVRYGDPSTLAWNVSNATSISIDQGIGAVPAVSSIEVRPQADTTFTLTASNNDGQVTAQAAIIVRASARFEIVSYSKRRTPFGTCILEGVVKNTGNAPGHKLLISFTAYDVNNVIIDSASAFPNTLKTIFPSTAVAFEAVFYKLTNWSPVQNISAIFTWVDGIGILKHLSISLSNPVLSIYE